MPKILRITSCRAVAQLGFLTSWELYMHYKTIGSSNNNSLQIWEQFAEGTCGKPRGVPEERRGPWFMKQTLTAILNTLQASTGSPRLSHSDSERKNSFLWDSFQTIVYYRRKFIFDFFSVNNTGLVSPKPGNLDRRVTKLWSMFIRFRMILTFRGA